MFATRAILPLDLPTRPGAAGRAAPADRAGFPAALAAAKEEGEPGRAADGRKRSESSGAAAPLLPDAPARGAKESSFPEAIGAPGPAQIRGTSSAREPAASGQGLPPQQGPAAAAQADPDRRGSGSAPITRLSAGVDAGGQDRMAEVLRVEGALEHVIPGRRPRVRAERGPRTGSAPDPEAKNTGLGKALVGLYAWVPGSRPRANGHPGSSDHAGESERSIARGAPAPRNDGASDRLHDTRQKPISALVGSAGEVDPGEAPKRASIGSRRHNPGARKPDHSDKADVVRVTPLLLPLWLAPMPAPAAPPSVGGAPGENPGKAQRDAADPITANLARAPTHPDPEPSIAPGAAGAPGDALAGLAAEAEGAASPETSAADSPSPAAGGRPHPDLKPSAAVGVLRGAPPGAAGPPAAPQIAAIPAGEKTLSSASSAPPAGGAPPDPGLFAGLAAGTANPAPAEGADAAGTAQAAPQTPPGLAEQLSGPVIAAAARDGHHDLALRLHPPGLGDVAVRVVVSGRAVSAWFDSPQFQVQQAISQSIGELHRDLAMAGYDLSGAWVGGEAWTPRERRASPPAPRPVRSLAGPAPAAARRSAPLAAGSGVSVYV